MKKILFLVILLGGISLFSCVTEQKTVQTLDLPGERCDAPIWSEGDMWRFVGSGREQWEERIIRKDNKLEIIQTPKKELHAFGSIPIVGLKLFPLRVGKKFEGVQTANNVDGIPLNYFYSIKVVGMMDVKVEAGSFKCYKIEFKISYSSSEGVGYYYYSPETKSIVKFETGSHMLYQWKTFELVSFKIK